jgi:hypothetical protein
MSISREQAAALTEPILRDAESNKNQYTTDATSLPAMERLLLSFGERFIKEVQDNLDRLGKADTGALGKSIEQGDIIQTGTKYELTIGYPRNSDAAEYYDYQNKGVKGLVSGQPSDSPYQFRTKKIHPKMARAILGWLQRGNASQRNEDQRTGLSALQTKRTSFKDLSPTIGLAYIVALRIKNKGIDKSSYFDDAIRSVFGSEFARSVSIVIGKDMSLYIRNGNY